MPIARNIVDQSKFNPNPVLPYELRVMDFSAAMQDVYDFFYEETLAWRTRHADRNPRPLRHSETPRELAVSGINQNPYTSSSERA